MLYEVITIQVVMICFLNEDIRKISQANVFRIFFNQYFIIDIRRIKFSSSDKIISFHPIEQIV